ncbi:MAG: hypothetical protein UX04_C0002G0218 [Microgenomates group bacterium GW2011_GWF2_45_18]|nr:MAG: hypothetical protein UW18_C0003G0344 [Microgenomates group bacterium GW2011_GWF1_44_10]KKU02075.1 MAG: hypothetical protein UX04_C0002G0218 [Microgenomates group bacterium GW2011_GWF2_45_18]HAU98629.1 hypothetical protein [Candidatus Paceibacterota bacterium]HAX01501.1 hypothetical protein [Candidatus Paceibacterota bacterium]
MNTNSKDELIIRHGAFVLAALVVAFFLSSGKCVPDPYCDPDPIRGGCSQICEDAELSLGKLALRSFGVWMLLKFGESLGKHD